MPDAPRAASIIVPTYRESANIEPLVRRAFAALQHAGIDAELILVDDNSRDGTEETVRRLQTEHPVRILVRTTERGLSSAVVAGFREARTDRLVVLDADLQHPPELIPDLLRRLDEPGCEFVLATRYAGGSLGDEWPWHRRMGSALATLLARPLVPLSDPMSGFFAIPRAVWERAAPRVNPIGYKIALEVFVKARCTTRAEVPFRFDARAAGESKLGLKTQFAYLRHLERLYAFRYPAATWIVRLILLGVLAAAIAYAL